MNEESSSLLECPACGNTPTVAIDYCEKFTTANRFFIECSGCECRLATPSFEILKDAVENWNTLYSRYFRKESTHGL